MTATLVPCLNCPASFMNHHSAKIPSQRDTMCQIPNTFSLLADHFESVTAINRTDFGIEDWHQTLKAVNTGGSLSDALQIVTAILPELEPVELSVATTLLAESSRYGTSKVYHIHDMTQRPSHIAKSHGGSLLERMGYWTSTWTI